MPNGTYGGVRGRFISPYSIASVLTGFSGKHSKIKDYSAARHSRKRWVVSQRRYECACKRIDDANVTFCK